MTRQERRRTEKKYGRKLKNDQLLKITAVVVVVVLEVLVVITMVYGSVCDRGNSGYDNGNGDGHDDIAALYGGGETQTCNFYSPSKCRRY